jgi:hypothetical protein
MVILRTWGVYYLDFSVLDVDAEISSPAHEVKALDPEDPVLETNKVALPLTADDTKRPFQPNPSDEFTPELESRRFLINWLALQRPCWALAGMQLGHARTIGLCKSLSTLSARDLEALDDSNVLIKFLTIAQVFWLMIQLLVREIRGLPSSQLEIAVLAFAVSSFITYSIFLGRPRNITRRWKISALRHPTQCEARNMWLTKSIMWRQFLTMQFTLAYMELTVGIFLLSHSAIFGSVIFGGLHCFACNFVFPTPIEALMWRICSALTTALPVISTGLVWLFIRVSSSAQQHSIGSILVCVFLVPYVLARLFLLAEMFRSLFYLPPEAFKETWSGSFPHWG